MPNSPVAPGTNFVFFGDSLSDNGNLEDAAQGVLPQAVLDQINGFDGRASNGLTFVEYISALLGLPEGLNYAIAGGEASGHRGCSEKGRVAEPGTEPETEAGPWPGWGSPASSSATRRKTRSNSWAARSWR